MKHDVGFFRLSICCGMFNVGNLNDTLRAVVPGERVEPLQATVWISIEHALVTKCPLSELSDFGQSEQTRALDERATKGQQFNW